MSSDKYSPLDDNLSRYAVSGEATMRDVLAAIDTNGEGVAVIVDAKGHFLGIVTDGDIRRAILAQLDFEQSAQTFIEQKTAAAPSGPGIGALTAKLGTQRNELRMAMDEHGVRHMPLIDDDGMFAGLALMSEIGREHEFELPLCAVVMAGGFGERLRPLTNKTPKPLLPIGEKPVIERIIDQLRRAGIHDISITTHFQAEKIKDYFGDGKSWGVNLSYLHEDEPLGTAGALSMLEDKGMPVVVINGDILTSVDFRAMLSFHREHDAELTVGVRKYEFQVPFGVIDSDGVRVTKLEEKPAVSLFINAGIYLLEPGVVRKVAADKRSDMTDLIEGLIQDDAMVASFPIHEYWADIGQLKDYVQAQTDVGSGKFNG